MLMFLWFGCAFVGEEDLLERMQALEQPIEEPSQDTQECTERAWYWDGDGDGYGAGAHTWSCEPLEGHIDQDGDCDDREEATHPEAEEICDGVDNDCDGIIDDDVTVPPPLYRDEDGDGVGDEYVLDGCIADGYSLLSGDCDDHNPLISPLAEEIAGDGIDQNCDGLHLCYEDLDRDGFGFTEINGSLFCTDEVGVAVESAKGGDCDETTFAIHPGALESFDDIDHNCDGEKYPEEPTWSLIDVGNFVVAQESLSADKRFISMACVEQKVFLLFRTDLREVYDWQFSEVFSETDVQAIVESNPESIRVGGCGEGYHLVATHYGWDVGEVFHRGHYGFEQKVEWINSDISYGASDIFISPFVYAQLYSIYNNHHDVWYYWEGMPLHTPEELIGFLHENGAIDARIAHNGELFFLLWR